MHYISVSLWRYTNLFIVIIIITTQPFNGLFSRTTWVSRYQKGKTKLDFTEARDSEWQWHQLGHMHVCTSLQTDNYASTRPLCFFTGWMPFLLPNQQRQSTIIIITADIFPVMIGITVKRSIFNISNSLSDHTFSQNGGQSPWMGIPVLDTVVVGNVAIQLFAG